MTDEVQEFRKFLDDTSPTEFQRTSAISIVPTGYSGSSGFNNFIQRRLAIAEDTFDELGEDIAPLIYLANADEERAYEAYHDETFREMFARIHREAQDMDATMTFIAMLVPAAKVPLDINGLDESEVNEAIERGDLTMHYGWYAEHRTNEMGDDPDRRGGLWDITEDEELGDRTDGAPKVAPLFHSVLQT